MTPNDGNEATIVMNPAAPGGGGDLAAPMARLVCLDDTQLDPKQKGLVIVLSGGIHTVGRNAHNTDPILYQGVSGQHARIFPSQGQWTIEDLGSTNGVWIKGIREKQAFLVSGDLVKIGPVPFQFVVDDPVSAAPFSTGHGRTEDDDATVSLVGNQQDNPDKMGEWKDPAQAEKRAEQPHKEAIGTGATSSIPTRVEGNSQKKSNKMIWLSILLAALAGGGYGAYLLQKEAGSRSAVQRYQKEIKTFSNSAEMAKGTLSHDDLKRQVSVVEGLIQSLAMDLNRYSDNQEMKELQVRLQFLLLERQLILLTPEGRSQQIEPMVNELVALTSADWTRRSEKQAWLKDMRELLNLVKDVVTVQQFRQRYPQPAREAADRPSQEGMTRVDKAIENIVKQKNDNNINILLSVQFPLFGRVVTQVNEEDLSIIRQWKALL